MKIRPLIETRETDGWRLVRVRGTHRQFKHPIKRGTITVAGKRSAEAPRGTLKVILERAELKDRGQPCATP